MNLVICGDFEHFGLEISNPEETLVSSIIERVATTLDIPSVEISLYFNDQLLQPASPLSPQCGTQLRSGAALLVTATPLIITIQQYDTDLSFNVEISRLAAPRWKTDTLFDFCLYKAGMPNRKDGKYVFTVQGTVLKSNRFISDDKFLNNNFTISITFLQAVICQDPITSVYQSAKNRSVLIPSGCTDDKIFSGEQTKCTLPLPPPAKPITNSDYVQFGSPSSGQYKTKHYGQWKLTIQKIDGAKKIIELENHYHTPVYELRNKVSSYDKIRLTIGETVLEDFDEEGHIMLLCSYPQLHDGATLYQINLPDAIRVNCEYKQDYTSYSKHIKLHKPLDEVLHENFRITRPHFICIENPKNFTVQRLVGAMENFGRISGVETNGQCMSRNELSCLLILRDAVVSSVKYFDNNCKVELTQYSAKMW